MSALGVCIAFAAFALGIVVAWLFRPRVDHQIIAALKQARDEANDECVGLYQQLGSAKSAMSAMQKAVTDEGIADIARAVTAKVADIYAAGRHSVRQRDVAVHAVVAAAVRKASTGTSAWNEEALATKGQGGSNA